MRSRRSFVRLSVALLYATIVRLAQSRTQSAPQRIWLPLMQNLPAFWNVNRRKLPGSLSRSING